MSARVISSRGCPPARRRARRRCSGTLPNTVDDGRSLAKHQRWWNTLPRRCAAAPAASPKPTKPIVFWSVQPHASRERSPVRSKNHARHLPHESPRRHEVAAISEHRPAAAEDGEQHQRARPSRRSRARARRCRRTASADRRASAATPPRSGSTAARYGTRPWRIRSCRRTPAGWSRARDRERAAAQTVDQDEGRDRPVTAVAGDQESASRPAAARRRPVPCVIPSQRPPPRKSIRARRDLHDAEHRAERDRLRRRQSLRLQEFDQHRAEAEADERVQRDRRDHQEERAPGRRRRGRPVR